MNFEVEIKFRVADHEALARRIDGLGGELEETIELEDHYLAHPARDFSKSDEALRLRRVGTVNRITYKGPKRVGPTKTREEIEIRFADGENELRRMARLFDNLGFRPVAVVSKSRTIYQSTYQGRPMEIGLDHAPGLGNFAEIETLAASEDDLADAQEAVMGLASLLGLNDIEPRSYLRMTLENG